MKSILKTRRRFLHFTAAGGILAPFFNQLQALAATNAVPKKVAFVFFPHGTPDTSGFWPGEGPLASLNGVLAPLQAHRNRMLVVGGLGSGLEKGYGHSGGNTAVLTGRGSSNKDGGFYIPMSPSADWLIARQIKQEPLVLGQKVSSGARLLISWSEPKQAGAVTPTNDVGEAFKRVYGRTAAAGECTTGGGLTAPAPVSSAGDANVLDVVVADLNALKASLPTFSRSTLDDQLDSISDLQAKAKAVGSAPKPMAPSGTGGGTSEGCYAAGTSDFYQRSNYMADLMVAAFQSGTRRVGVFQQGTASGDSFSVPGFGGYHGEVHNISNGTVGDLSRITKMQTEIFKDIGYFVDRLGATKDLAGEPLLASTLVYICTEFSTFSATSDPHNTGGGMVVNLVGGDGFFNTTGKAITAKGSVGGVLRHAAKYMDVDVGSGLSITDIGKFDGLAGIAK